MSYINYLAPFFNGGGSPKMLDTDTWQSNVVGELLVTTEGGQK